MKNEKRRDNKGRVLHNGEIQLPDGRYRYKYIDANGEEKYVTCWRLDKNDVTPRGKKNKPSLREIEKQIQSDMLNQIVSNGGNMKVSELVKKYISTRTSVRPTTKAGYNTVCRLLEKDDFGKKRIDTVKQSDAKIWLIKLQQKDGKRFSTIHTIRGVLRPAFKLALDDQLILKNPFEFKLGDVIVNDSVKREAITLEEERKFLEFVKEDKHFSKYYDGIYILFNLGIRISEFCGLTLSNIDLKNHRVTIDHQLQKHKIDGEFRYYIEKTKTTSGIRVLPLTEDVEECFRRIIKNRNAPKVEPVVDGKSGFLYFDKNGNIMYSLHWENYFKHIREKYNKTHSIQMPKVTPHVARHTYCSNMAKEKGGMNPKILQYLMGHSDIGVTLNCYTHINYEDACEEVARINSI